VIGAYFWLWGLAVAVGVFTHIACDARTISGVPTRGGGRWHLGRSFTTGSPYERHLLATRYRPAAVVSVAAVVWLLFAP
jgi:hypothetical protein